jgi:hypothetical protein
VHDHEIFIHYLVEFGISFSPNDASSLTICLIARILADSSVSLTFCVMHKLLVFSLKEQTVKLFLIFYKSTGEGTPPSRLGEG